MGRLKNLQEKIKDAIEKIKQKFKEPNEKVEGENNDRDTRD